MSHTGRGPTDGEAGTTRDVPGLACLLVSRPLAVHDGGLDVTWHASDADAMRTRPDAGVIQLPR